MWRKLKRWSAMLLAAFLVFTSVQYTGLIAEAENTTTLNYDSGSTVSSVKETTGGVEFSFDANYQELKFVLGQTIDATKIMSAKFNISGLTSGQKLALKFYDASGAELAVKYDLVDNFVLTAADITGMGEVSAIGIMANMDGASGSAVFGGVDFVAKTGDGDVTKTYKALDGVVTLAENYKYGGVSYTGTDDGKLVIVSQYAGQQLQMKPASNLNIDDYKSVTFNVSELNGSYTFAANAWGGAYFTSDPQTAAGTFSFDISGKSGELNYFTFDNQDGAGAMTVDSIVLTKHDDTIVTVTMPQTGYTVGNTDGTVTIANGALTTAMASGYKSTFLTMPGAVSSADWDKVTVNVSAMTGEAIIRPVDSATTWGDPGVCADIACSAAGAYDIDMSTATGSIEQFRVMSLQSDITMTIDSIVLSKTPSATISFNSFVGVTGDDGTGSDPDPEPDVPTQDAPVITGELVVTNASMQECNTDTTGATFSFNNVEYESLVIKLPAAVSTVNLESITYDIEVLENGENICFALKDETGGSDTSWGNASTFVYAKPAAGWKAAAIDKLGIMTHGRDNNLSGATGSVKFKGFTFTYADGSTLVLNQFAAPKVTSKVAYNFNDIKNAGYRNASNDVDELGRSTLTFGGDSWGYYAFAVPDEIAGMTITNIKMYATELIEGTPSIVAIKLYDDASANCDTASHYEVDWNGRVISDNGYNVQDTEKTLVKFCIAAGAQQTVKMVVRKVEFTVEGVVEGGSDFVSEVSYNFNDLTAVGGWKQVSSVTAKDGKLTMNFAEKYGEVQFAIPDDMLGKKITKMSFSTSVGNAANLAVKLYAGDTAAVEKYGETSFDIATEEDITKFAFMLNSDDVSPIVIDKVTFVVEADVESGSEFITEAYTTVPAAALEPIISGNAVVLDAVVNGGKLGINFNEEGAAVFFKIPSYVDMSKVKYIDLEDVVSALSLVDTTYGTALNGVKLNAYTAADFATKTPTLTSDTSAVVTDGNANIKYIGLVSTAATASVSMTRVGFVEKNITKTGDMFSWTADNFVFDATNSTASATSVDDNKWLCTFEEADDIAIFELPETFITGNAKDFAIAISKRDVPVVLSFLDADMNEVWSTNNPQKVQNYYSVDTVASRVDVKAKYLAISVKEGGAKMCVLDGMSANKRVFSNEPYVVPTYTILTYTAADVLKMEGDGWSGSGFEKLGETVKVNLPGTYGEVSFKLPVKIDLSQCESVNIKLKNQNLPIAVKLMKNYDAVVVNYDRVLGERNFAPFSDAQINKFSLMSLESAPHSSAEFESITFTIKGDYVPEAISTGGIIVNGNFDDPDVSDWKAAFWDDVTITTEVSSSPIFGNVNTYGVYSKRTSPYQCFAQDITGRVVQDGTYTFSFWAKLSDDYKGAPDNQRVVQFSPYTVDVNGVADYNPNLQGVYAQTLEVGKWTKYEGIWKVTNANQIESVFVRILEQGTNYGQGDCVLGSYAITGVEIKEYIPDPPSIDEDVPDLKAALTQEFGDGFIVGTAITGNEFDDIGVEMLANKHFNAITLGNELKPDAMMGYSETHTALQTITFNGQKLVVPTLTFSSADAKLNTILKWNKKHPESPIKVRGHVLVWHSQTMEWFFRENYVIGQNADGSENYVTPEEMNLRLEWYIKTVLEHYTGEDSPYKDLFYGWDVVNEAVSDGTGTYRTDTVTKAEKPSDTRHGSNSSWWAVYKSNEFVIKAFQYANKYAPAELELYYNDYNDTETRKVKGIVQLLKDVLAAEGTRIDAMGMQGHYNLYNPGMGSLEQAIRQYCAVVGKVQLTELDLKASDYLGSDAALEREYASQALHYKKIHDLLLRLDAEDGIDISGVTFWGTIDTYSWLQDGSNVGGGSDGSMRHCPLLFDGNYKVKPAYWAWVDYSMVDPDYVADNTSGGSSTQNPDKDTDDKDETESTESVEQTESLTVPVIKDEEEKSSVAGPIAAVAGVVVVGAGLGAFFWNKKRKSIGE